LKILKGQSETVIFAILDNTQFHIVLDSIDLLIDFSYFNIPMTRTS